MKKGNFALISLFLFLFLFSNVSFAVDKLEEPEGTSKYIVEARAIVIEGQSAIDLYNALNDQTIEYPGNQTGIKKKNNVTCEATISTARGSGEFVSDANCVVLLSESTAINK